MSHVSLIRYGRAYYKRTKISQLRPVRFVYIIIKIYQRYYFLLLEHIFENRRLYNTGITVTTQLGGRVALYAYFAFISRFLAKVTRTTESEGE